MRLIDADKTLKIAESYGTTHGTTLGRHSGVADIIHDEITKLPTIEAEPERHGKLLKNANTIGARIKILIKSQGITQEEFAKNVGVSRQMMNYWVNDKRKISLKTIGKIAKNLDVSCDYLIFGEMDGGEISA